MTSRLTAAEARQISGPSVDDHVDEALEVIRLAAEKKERHACLTSNFWINEGYKPTENYQAASKLLENLGYQVEFFYEERQFVDMYTIVRW